MKTLQTILGAFLLTLTACKVTPKQGEPANRRESDTTSIETGELLLQRDSVNGVTCYHRHLADGLFCIKDSTQ